MKYGLIFVEGLPGCGKSTLSRFLSIQLRRQGHNALWLHEDAPENPLRLVHDAWLSQPQWEEVKHRFPRARSLSPETSAVREEPICVNLYHLARTLGESLDTDLMCELRRYRPASLSADRYCQCLALKWDRFARSIELMSPRCAYVVDGCLFQSNIYGMLLYGAKPSTIERLIRQLMDVAKNFNPCLIQLEAADLAKMVASQRKVRSQTWLDAIVERDALTPYYRAHRGSRTEIYLRLLADYQEMAHRLWREATWPSLAQDISRRNRSIYPREALRFLGLRYLPNPVIPEARSRLLAGAYVHSSTHLRVNLRRMRGTWHFIVNPSCVKRLIPDQEDVFLMADMGYGLRFGHQPDGTIEFTLTGTTCYEDWPEPGSVFVKVTA